MFPKIKELCARQSPRLYEKRFLNTLIDEYFLGKITPEV